VGALVELFLVNGWCVLDGDAQAWSLGSDTAQGARGELQLRIFVSVAVPLGVVQLRIRGSDATKGVLLG